MDEDKLMVERMILKHISFGKNPDNWECGVLKHNGESNYKIYVEACIEYSNQQNADLIKQIEELKNVWKALIDKYFELSKELEIRLKDFNCSQKVCHEQEKEIEELTMSNEILLKENESLSQVIGSQKQTSDAILKKYNELEIELERERSLWK